MSKTGKNPRPAASISWGLARLDLSHPTDLATYQIMHDELSYVCDHCGEEIVIPLDLSQGSSQEYVEDCPVCCSPNVIHVEFDEEFDDEPRCWAEPE